MDRGRRAAYGRRLRGALVVPALLGCAEADAISLDEERALGEDLAGQVAMRLPLVRDSAAAAFVRQLGRGLAARIDSTGRQYEFVLVDSRVVNAFAIPGGFIFINRGIVERASNASELAGVVAHEIGHVVARHSVEALQRERSANTLLGLVYLLLQRQPSEGEQLAVQVVGGAWMARHSREDEREADRLALRVLTRAGLDPRGLPGFFSTLLAEERAQSPLVLQWFSTHPLTAERVAAADTLIATLPDDTLDRLRADLPEFQRVRERLLALPPPPEPVQ
ncbi:MAG TPA: M48 family metallopeptidase [Gemmatimonadaceae bacterium]|nr:M48 family metallopeptidase [Gemmatimonadaceae bacterium]